MGPSPLDLLLRFMIFILVLVFLGILTFFTLRLAPEMGPLDA